MKTQSSPLIPFDNSYARLPERFFSRVRPMEVCAPRLVCLNQELARDLGFDPEALATHEGISILSGNRIAEGSDPLAMAYAGHQFGNFVPQLGDGRALLLGEVLDKSGRRCDLHLKGSGRTPYSRQGDGRAALGPVLREYIVSEAFAALGIPTTRALAALRTGEWVYREEPLPGAILVRVASSHIRVGTFEFFSALQDQEGLRLLADYVIERHYPHVQKSAEPYRDLLAAVVERQASLIAQWMLVGFIHGVMNTDNTSISGETIDFGPCAFMDSYHPAKVFSSIDYRGRYAFSNQPNIAHWNLLRFAETLLPLLSQEPKDSQLIAQEVVDCFPSLFKNHLSHGFACKLGLENSKEEDLVLIEDLLTAMAKGDADFTLTFRRLSDAVEEEMEVSSFKNLFSNPEEITVWLQRWRERLKETQVSAQQIAERMRSVNPALIPRNHQIEKAIAQAVNHEDFSLFHRMVEALASPFVERRENDDLMHPPAPHEIVTQTFCGT